MILIMIIIIMIIIMITYHNIPIVSRPLPRLITSSGRALDAAESLALWDSDEVVTAVALRMELTAAVKAVALWCYGGGHLCVVFFWVFFWGVGWMGDVF